MKGKEFRILGMSHNQTSVGSFVIVLAHEAGDEKIPVIVKSTDAIQIATYLKGGESIKANVYDMVRSMTQHFDIRLHKIEVYKVLEGIFYVRLRFVGQDSEIYLECPIGEALVLSVVYGISIYVSKEVSDKYAIILNDDGSVDVPVVEEEDPIEVIEKDIKKLESLINEALESEEYEKAAKLRDEIDILRGGQIV